MMDTEILNGKSIYLKPIDDLDTENIIKWKNSPHVLKNFFIQDLLTKEQHSWWLENKVKLGLVIQYIIFEKEQNEAIGSVFIKDIDKQNKKGEYGIFIGEEKAKGKGYGTEACYLICNYALNKLALNKIYLRVYATNEVAIKSYKKNGFIIEGKLREEIFLNGRFKDILIMSKFKEKGGI